MSCILKLKDICNINGGYAFKSTQYKSEGTPLIRIGDISGKNINISTDMAYIDDDINKYDKFIIKKGDILIALSGATTGKFGMYNYDEVALLNQRVARITPNKLICNGYLFHYMNILEGIIYSKASGCAQPNISPSEISELDIYVPSVKEQEKIVEVLDKSKILIDKRKEQIEALDELVKSRFIEMFGNVITNSKGWETELLGEICALKAGKNIKAKD
ncbi:MAG: restriction endonuclease subunit S, partial [Peptostreptococcaceae bacterium]